MDFGTLLHVAKKNSESSKVPSKYYNTKYAPPKKETKEKKLSENIQKFLQKREQEERERQLEEKRKLNNLLAMRDDKSKNKIKKMLKVTKSANKSVLDDSLDEEHRVLPRVPAPLEEADQIGQDDYGYVSTEANAFYQKYIEKVKDVKEDKGFAPSRPQSLKDLSGTKERVKAAITKEIEDKSSHTRHRSSANSSTTATTSAPSAGKDTGASVSRAYSTSKSLYDPEEERRDEQRKKREEEQKRAKQRRPAPPPMDFQALLKLAEKKQHEPVEVLLEVKKKKEPERLLTLKEKREMEERKRAQEARERRKREQSSEAPAKERRESGAGVARMEANGRIPKLNQAAKSTAAAKPSTASQPPAGRPSVGQKIGGSSTPAKSSSQGHHGDAGVKKPISSATTTAVSSSKVSSATATVTKSKTPNAPCSSSVYSTQGRSTSSTLATKSAKSVVPPKGSALSGSVAAKNPYNGPSREFPPRDMKSIKTRPFPPPDVQKTRQFPPADVRRGPPADKKKPQAPKRRIIDDDEDEYDSDLDDFIDDGDDTEDYSAHIKAIFGYDKSRYRDLDEDDAAMESNFAQVQREEYISKKIGLQEDLDDMKLEAMEKKRKMTSKKRKI